MDKYQQFFNLKLNLSRQEQNCITLENWIDQLTNPDFRENLKLCTDSNGMINLFPIVGYGLQIQFKQQNGYDVKVKSISHVERIIDLTTIEMGMQNLTRDRPNCILPLLKKEEQNDKLLESELFKRKISYLITKNHQIYNENSYIILIQSTLKYLIKVNNNSQWQQEMLQEIFEVCEQIFTKTDLFQQQIQMEEFNSSQFQLLSVYCLFLQKKITPEQIYNNFILPKLRKIGSFSLNDEGQFGLGKFFDSINLGKIEIDFHDINICIQRYLDENDYFYSKLIYGKYLSNLIEFFIPNKIAKEKLKEQLLLQQQNSNEGNKMYEQKNLITNFFQSAIYKYLFNKLINDFEEEKKIQYFQSLNQAVEQGNYYSFLQSYSKYEDLVQYYNLNILLSNEHSYGSGISLFIQYMVQQLLKQISINQLRRIEFQNWEQMKNSNEITEKSKKIQKFATIFGINGPNLETVEDVIKNTIAEICWLNYQALKINCQNDEEIVKYLQLIKEFPQTNNLKEHFNLHQKFLNDISQFCFKIRNQTQFYKHFDQFETPKRSSKGQQFSQDLSSKQNSDKTLKKTKAEQEEKQN